MLCHIEENHSQECILFCFNNFKLFLCSLYIGGGRTVIFWVQRGQSSFRSISKSCAGRGRKSDFAESSIAEKID